MKRVSILALIMVFCFAGAAMAEKKEIDKGTILVGGVSTLGLLLGSHTIEPEDADEIKANTTAFALLGYGGYFVMDGLEVGPVLGFGYGKVEVDQDAADTTGTMSMWDFGVQAAYLFDMGKSKSYAPFAQLALEYMSGKMEYEVDVAGVSNKTKSELSGWSATPRGGVMFFLHKRFALDLSVFIKYISASGSTENGQKLDMDATSMNYGILLGFNGFIK